MTEKAEDPVPTPALATAASGRRSGYVASVLVSAVVFWLANGWPGWQAVPFLTDGMVQVMGLFNLSLAVSVAVNLINIATGRQWTRALGEIITSAVGLAVVGRIWAVFPFDFGNAGFDWSLVVRWVLVFASIGCVISIIVQMVILVRLAAGTTPNDHLRRPQQDAGNAHGSGL